MIAADRKPWHEQMRRHMGPDNRLRVGFFVASEASGELSSVVKLYGVSGPGSEPTSEMVAVFLPYRVDTFPRAGRQNGGDATLLQQCNGWLGENTTGAWMQLIDEAMIFHRFEVAEDATIFTLMFGVS